MTTAGFPHSETLGSQPGCRLPEDYRRLQRPSSAPGTKTSTVCPYKLDTRHYMQNSADYRRCSRPLCSSQDTDGTMRQDLPSGRSCPQAVRVSALRKRLLPQDPTVCSESSLRRPSFRSSPEGKSVLTESPQVRKPNSQCSTRKHGRPVTHSVTRGAGAP